MPDLADDIFDGTFDVTVSYTPYGGSATNVQAIIAEGNNPGRESGKGLTEAIRGSEARFARIYLKTSEVATEPIIHSTVTDENTTIWDILSSKRVRANTWLCEAQSSANLRRRR